MFIVNFTGYSNYDKLLCCSFFAMHFVTLNEDRDITLEIMSCFLCFLIHTQLPVRPVFEVHIEPIVWPLLSMIIPNETK